MQMPTGTGKTVVLAEMVRQYLNSHAVGHCNSYGDGDNDAAGNGTSCAERCRVLIVAHRIELIEQMGEHLKRYDIDYGFIAKGKKAKEMKSVMVASIQTISSQLNALTSTLLLSSLTKRIMLWPRPTDSCGTHGLRQGSWD